MFLSTRTDKTWQKLQSSSELEENGHVLIYFFSSSCVGSFHFFLWCVFETGSHVAQTEHIELLKITLNSGFQDQTCAPLYHAMLYICIYMYIWMHIYVPTTVNISSTFELAMQLACLVSCRPWAPPPPALGVGGSTVFLFLCSFLFQNRMNSKYALFGSSHCLCCRLKFHPSFVYQQPIHLQMSRIHYVGKSQFVQLVKEHLISFWQFR